MRRNVKLSVEHENLNKWSNGPITKSGEGNNRQQLIESISKIVVSQPNKVIKLLNSYGFKAASNIAPTALGSLVSTAITKNKKFAEQLVDLIIDGKFSADGDKEETVVLMGRTFGAKNPFFNARGVALQEENYDLSTDPTTIEMLLGNQIALDAANAANETVLGGGGMSIGMKVGITVLAIGVVIAGLKIAKVF